MVFLNETKTKLPRLFLNNYNATSEHKQGLDGVAKLHKEEIPYVRLSELEKNSANKELRINKSVKWYKIGHFNCICTTREPRWSQEHNERFEKL